MNTGAREWDADTYDRVSDPQFEWGLEVLERLELCGDETVLDAGCGSGRVTAKLVERLPRGRVIAVDGSPAMVEKAKETLGDSADVRVADLAELDLEEPVDLIFSTAVFHWLPDHDNLFARLFAALKPGGRLVAQCGGDGNVAELAQAIVAVAGSEQFAGHFEGMPMIWHFASPEQTKRRLEGAGFGEPRCWLEEKPVTPERPLDFLATVTLGPHLDRLPADLRDPFTEAVAKQLGDPLTLVYVRLNIEARRPEAGAAGETGDA
jgi:trans-aconitate 2-methyltransferase